MPCLIKQHWWNIVGGTYFEHTTIANCQGKYSTQGFTTKSEAEEACKKDRLCAGFRGTMRLPSSNPNCENDVQIFYLCKSMSKTRNQASSHECFWKKTLGGLIDNVVYGKGI